MCLVRVDIRLQHRSDPRAVLLFHKAKMQCQNQRSLRLTDQASRPGHIFFPEGGEDLLPQRAVTALVFRLLQQLCRIGNDLQAPQVAGVGGKIVIRCTFARLAKPVHLRVQAEPVSVLEAGLPQPVLSALCRDEVYPDLHALILFRENPFIAVSLVQCPGQNRRHVAPVSRTALTHAHDIRHDLRHSDLRRLFAGKIPKPLLHERKNVFIKCSRRSEGRRISGPAEPLTALRAVCGNIQIIIALTPQNVLLQTADQLIGTGKTSGLSKIRGEMAGSKLRFLPLLEAFHPQIAEAVESKVRPKHLCGTA